MDNTDPNIEAHLATVNHRLSELLRTPPLALATGGTQSLGDPLWVWGILGGKDVGKSTLINALADGEVVHGGSPVGEGTFQPAAYLHQQNRDAAEVRFAAFPGLTIDFHADAPASMGGLVLVDLPDFDSMYTSHIEQVRTVAGALDGIIWVTTPKKVGDLRAINEIHRVLKSRKNFVYVVNKMDWLLSQSDGPPNGELDRLSAALEAQMAECATNGDGRRSFFISARHQTASSILEEIARCRALPDANVLVAGESEMTVAAERVARDFDALRSALTTAPTAEVSAENKQANLTYQTRAQAQGLLDHYQPRAALEHLRRNASVEVIAEILRQSFPPVYCDQLVQRLNADRMPFAEWSSLLFRQRIAFWPVLGVIAWPLAFVGAVLGSLRRLVPRGVVAPSEDPFRFDGLTLDDRANGAFAGVRARLARIADRIEFSLPSANELAQQFRADVGELASAHREAVFEPLRRGAPSRFGRALRWVAPIAVLIWFPLAQPLLAGLLHAADGASGVRVVVDLLSASNVLMGLGVSLLILCGLVACIYSGAVRDSFAALDRLRGASPEFAVEPLTGSLARAIGQPIESACSALSEITSDLEALADGNRPGTPSTLY